MIDINNTLDLIKLKFYNEWLYTSHLQDEGESIYHEQLTKEVVVKYVDTLNLKKDATILDLGCGAGYFLDEMKSRKYTNVTGVTISEVDSKICKDKGHTVKECDFNFLPQTEGFHDESVDFIFLRHSLEHSPYPIFTLTECNRVLKQFGKMYIEVPAPDCERRHEFNLNIYSILGNSQLSALLSRTGFNIDAFNDMEFDLNIKQDDGTDSTTREKYFCISVTKQRPLDIK